jgi:hypothetical protein
MYIGYVAPVLIHPPNAPPVGAQVLCSGLIPYVTSTLENFRALAKLLYDVGAIMDPDNTINNRFGWKPWHRSAANMLNFLC